MAHELTDCLKQKYGHPPKILRLPYSLDLMHQRVLAIHMLKDTLVSSPGSTLPDQHRHLTRQLQRPPSFSFLIRPSSTQQPELSSKNTFEDGTTLLNESQRHTVALESNRDSLGDVPLESFLVSSLLPLGWPHTFLC